MNRYALHKWVTMVAFVGALLTVLGILLSAAPAPSPLSAPASAAGAADQAAKPATQTAKPAGQATTPATPARGRATTAPTTSPTGTPATAGVAPVIVIETAKGTIEFETYPKEAPKTVAHIVALVRRNFYNGQRFHRVVSGFVVQFGDPQTKDMRKKSSWGNGGSGKAIGVAEISPLHTHKRGAVAMANSGGNAATSDSQMYIVLSEERTRQLDGMYTVFGQVTSGMDVVAMIAPNDAIKRVSIKGDAPGLGSRGASSPAAAPKPTTPAK